MGHEQHGFFRLHPDLQQLLLHHFTGLRVERCEWLVHQQDLRVHDQRARKVHALLHAARELVGIMMLEAGKADHLDEMRRALLGLARADVEALQSVADIVQHRPPRQQRGILEHDRAVGPRLRHHAAVDQDAARARGNQAVDHREEHGLAAAGWPALRAWRSSCGCCSQVGARQTSTRCSIRCTISTNITPTATMVSTPTKTLSVWKRAPAWLIMAPTPAAEP